MLWQNVLVSQVDFTFGLELPAYYRMPEWHRARTVLDLGTGNGYYLYRLFREFPEKKYLGVDQSAEAVEFAVSQYGGPDICFETADLFNIHGSYDVIICRAVLQHVSNVAGLVAQMSALLSENGIALVIESDDVEPIFLWPRAPLLEGLFSAITRAQAEAQGTGAGILANFEELVNGCDTLAVARKTTVLVPTTIESNLDRFREQNRMVIDILQSVRAVEADFEAIRREWEEWCRLAHAYAHMQVTTVEVRKQCWSDETTVRRSERD
jgi:SAM-dependent methyltransferase